MLTCPACGASNPSGSRFCNACGERLREAGADARDTEAERRIVTMLFCDVRGSTAMAEQLDPEAWTDVMNSAYEVLIEPVVRYEGTVARLMGDAILAFFGAPTAHEDDPQRAVMAGLEIVSSIAPLRERLRAERGLDLDVRVGINTGPVVVGQVGSEHRQEYSAMGDAVNVAARMEQTAEPGTVQVTEDTYRLVADLFDVEALGVVELKGKRDPVAAFRVRRRLDAPWRVRASRRLEAPLIGRDEEVAVVRTALERARDGVGSVVLLVGEPGIGKSRLVEEANAIWAELEPGDDRRWDLWQCVPYDAMQPHAQYRRAIRERAGIAETDPPDLAREKISRLMGRIAVGDWRERSERVSRALLHVEREDEEPLQGEAFQRAATELVVGSTLALPGPHFTVFEDLHWCDHASLELIRVTTELVRDHPYVFLATYRPDREAPSWAFGEWARTEMADRTTTIELEPLSGAQSARLIEALVPEATSDEVRRTVLERSEGSPLFVQEIARALLERGAEDGSAIVIPDTVQSLITARLDGLPASARRTLQTAAVIGRTFEEGVLRTVAGDGDVALDLREVEERDLIRPSPPPPPSAFTFRHALTQEAAYGSLLLKQRRSVHARVARALEAAGVDRLDDVAPALVRHFVEAGEDEPAMRYALVAGDAAARLYANAEAEAHYRIAIDAGRRLGVETSVLRSAYERRGGTLELAARHRDAIANYEEMVDVARERADDAMELAARSAIALLYSTPTPLFDPERGRSSSEENVTMARRLGDRRAEARALWNILVANIYGGGDPRRAVEAGEASLAIARDLGETEQIAFTLNDVSRAYGTLGDFATSSARLEEARALWVELDNRAMLAENLTMSSLARLLQGDHETALAEGREAFEISASIDNRWGQAFALLAIYRVEWDRGDLGAATTSMRSCIELGEAGGFAYAGVAARADLAHVFASVGDGGRALEHAERSLEVALAEAPPAASVAYVALADAQVALGDLAAAETALDQVDGTQLPEPDRTFALTRAALAKAHRSLAAGESERAGEAAEEALATLRANDVRILVADTLVVRARVRLAQGRSDDAERDLADAAEIAERLGERLVLADALRLRADRRDDDGARATATRLVEEVAAGIADADLREAFTASRAGPGS
jgi:class 3 adenylate cyclase/tetratricopeptide (TPR) repeat protein